MSAISGLAFSPAANSAFPEFDFAALDALGVTISRVTSDSRKVRAGDAFLAYPGESSDGRKHIPAALAAGSAAVLWEQREFQWDEANALPNLAVENLRAKAGVIAERIYGNPSEKLWMIGVTGTNGKTSCAHWLAQALTGLGRSSALLGTLGNGFPGALTPSPNTTPDPAELHESLRAYLDQGAKCAAMEVSSHGLAQGRVNGVHFDVALLTNLTRDHLDYHGDMASYAAAKAGLFGWPGLKYAALNLDDPFGVALAAKLGCSGVQTVGYGFAGQRDNVHFAVLGGNLVVGAAGISFEAVTPWGKATVNSPLLGRFNAHNLLGVLATLLVSGIPLDDAIAALGKLRPVAGRLQTLGGGTQPLVVVDYAHTPDALEKTLQTLRETTPGRLLCVFGCGGGRDKGKRPQMGTIASRLADEAIVTSDNPRNEEAAAIIAEIVAGMAANYHVVEDRAQAIAAAIRRAAPNDTVLIAGKGHEDYQEIAGQRLPFSDVEVAARCLRDTPLC